MKLSAGKLIPSLTKNTATLARVFAIVWAEATPFVRIRVLLTLILLLSTSVLTALGPAFLQRVIDSLGQRNVDRTVLLFLALYIATLWIGRAIGQARGYVYARAEKRMFRLLFERVFGHIMRLPLRFHLGRQTGAVVQTLENGLTGFELILHQLVFTVLPVIAEVATIAVVLSGVTGTAYVLIFAGAVICYALAFGYCAHVVRAPAKEASASDIDATALMADALINFETVKYFAAENTVRRKLRSALIRTEEQWVEFFRRLASSGLLVASVFAGFVAITAFYSAHQAMAAHISLGTFIMINSYMLRISQPVELLGNALQGISQGLAMLDRVLMLLDEEPERASGRTDIAAGDPPMSVELAGVHFGYREGHSVLRGITFRIPPGGTLAIVGRSGSGKSTIVRLLTGMLSADSGEILIDGRPISELALPALRRQIAVVPQDTVLFDDSIQHNIAIGREGATSDQVVHAATLAGLNEFVRALPEGYATRVGERGAKLSGGEKQRLSIARAALIQPRLCIFDEATSSLDSRTERHVLDNLREATRGCTKIIVAHRLSTIAEADEIVVLDRGSIAETGKHDALLRRRGLYAEMWRLQSERMREADLSDA